MLSIEEIKNITFRKAGIGGYKPEDVDSFIDQVLITMEQLRKEKSDLVKKMDILATRVEEYRADEDAVRNAMLSAQRVADNTIKEARSKAAHMIEESENMAKAKLYDLNVQIKQQKKQYTLLLAECNRLRDEIINNCNKHIVIAKELPSIEKIQSMEASIEERYPTDKSDDYERADEIAATKVKDSSEENHNISSTAEADEIIADDDNSIDAAASIVDDIFDVNSDSKDDDVKIADNKKKTRSFSVLKFGDDYDLENDNDEASADSDNI